MVTLSSIFFLLNLSSSFDTGQAMTDFFVFIHFFVVELNTLMKQLYFQIIIFNNWLQDLQLLHYMTWFDIKLLVQFPIHFIIELWLLLGSLC